MSIVKKDDFIFLYAIGKGCFGKVWKAKYIKANNFLAIKQMSKTKIIDQNAERSVMQERLFLSYLKNKFIVNMICSFQDTNNLYLGLELMKGGDLRYHLINNTQTFTESQLKFLLSNLILGIEYIHSQNIIHRDIKPENILFDNKGYAYITDFNISCKKEDINNSSDVNGTPVYMAPETINLKEQDFSIDFYSLGIICYECIMGQRPYEGNSRHEVKEILNDNNFEIKQDERISIECRNLINGLLNQDPINRLGAQSGASELKENLFFQGFNWDLLSRKKYVSPLIEIINFSRAKSGIADELFDQEYCNKTEEIDENAKARYSQIIAHENYPNYFRQYTYLCKDAVIDIINKSRENGTAPPKKTLASCRSSENINLPKLPMKKSVSQKSITISNGGSYHHNHHNNNSRYSTKNRKEYVPHHSKHYNRLPSLRSNDSLKSYYEYKLNKYKNLLRNKNNMGYDDYPIMPIYNNNGGLFPFPNMNNMYSPPRFGGNGGDIYNDVCNGLQRKLYRDIFGGMEDDYNDNREGFRGGGRNLPNQYQINNYFPPSYMMPGMGMPNPYLGMMNPFPNNNGFFLPNIYDKGKHHHKHHHRHKSSRYSKSSYTKSSSKYHKSSKISGSVSTTNNKKKTKKSEETKKSNKKNDKKKGKKKETKNEEEEEEDDEGEENEDEEEEDSKSKKNKKKKDDDNEDEDEDNEGEEKEDDEDNEGDEDEDDEEDSKKKKKKKKGSDDDDDEDNDNEENEDEDNEDDDDEDSKKKKKKKGSDDEDDEDGDNEGEEKDDDEDGDGDGDDDE